MTVRTELIPMKGVFMKHGIPQGTRRLEDYERGKRLIQNLAPSSIQYEDMIRRLAEWVKV